MSDIHLNMTPNMGIDLQIAKGWERTAELLGGLSKSLGIWMFKRLIIWYSPKLEKNLLYLNGYYVYSIKYSSEFAESELLKFESQNLLNLRRVCQLYIDLPKDELEKQEAWFIEFTQKYVELGKLIDLVTTRLNLVVYCGYKPSQLLTLASSVQDEVETFSTERFQAILDADPGLKKEYDQETNLWLNADLAPLIDAD